MKGSGSGVSLPELLIAGAMFVLSTLPVITLFTQAGRAGRQGPDRALALALGHGVVEDLRASARDNPHARQALALDPPVAVEWPAGSAPPALFTQMAGVSGRLVSRQRALATSGAVLDLSLTVEWTSMGEEREVTLPFSLPVEPEPEALPALATDPVRFEETVRAHLYPEASGQALAQVLARRAAHASRVRALGEMCVLVDELERSRTPAGPEPASGLALLKWARAREARAARVLSVVVFLADRLGELFEMSAVDLGTPRVPPGRYQPQARLLAALAPELAREVALAQSGYARASAAGSLPPRARLRALVRAVEAAKLSTFLGVPGALERLGDLLQAAVAREAARRPDLAAWARTEQGRAGNIRLLRDGYPAQARLEALSRYDRVMTRSGTRLLSPF